MTQAVFAGLVFDEEGRQADVAFVGGEPCYVVDDAGFRRHIPSKEVDIQVLNGMREMVEGHENIISDQTAKMMGQDDIFTRAMIMNQLKNMDKQLDALFQTGIPEDARNYLGLMGFRVVINIHGEVVRVEQPTVSSNNEGD